MSQTKICVAIVDDDDSFSRALGRMLRATGFDPSIFNSAEAFLRAAAHEPADCLGLDVHLGGMSGLDLRRQLVARGTTTPVIFVTAHDDPECREEAYRLGCSAYLRKPVPGESLVGAIINAVAAHNSRPGK